MTTGYPILEWLLLAVLVGGVVFVVHIYRGLGGRRNVWWFVGLVWVMTSALPLSTMANPPPDEAHDFDCPIPGHDSTWGSSTWQTWPPGKVCHDDAGNVTRRPGAFNVLVAVAAVGGTMAFPALAATAPPSRGPAGAPQGQTPTGICLVRKTPPASLHAAKVAVLPMTR